MLGSLDPLVSMRMINAPARQASAVHRRAASAVRVHRRAEEVVAEEAVEEEGRPQPHRVQREVRLAPREVQLPGTRTWPPACSRSRCTRR